MSAVVGDSGLSCFTSAHRRYNPLSGDWIVVSPQRICRPWSGHTESSTDANGHTKKDDPSVPEKNPLSPGASRSNGTVNPEYTSVFTFQNDFPALSTESFDPADDDDIKRDALLRNELFAWAPAHGRCSVMCFHPRSDLTLARMNHEEVLRVIEAWCQTTSEYRTGTSYRWLQIFENRGAAVGSSNMHPHCQNGTSVTALPVRMEWHNAFVLTPVLSTVRFATPATHFRVWLLRIEKPILRMHVTFAYVPEVPFTMSIWACGFLPSLIDRYDRNQWRYFKNHQVSLLMDYARQEEAQAGQKNSRVVIQNEHWLVVVPWWACWPFETLVLPRQRHIRWLDELTAEERDSLTRATRELLIRYDNLFHTEFPYSMGWYQAPVPRVGCQLWSEESDYRNQTHWQLHALFQPPLLRSATVRKFMSGFELLAEAQRDLLPERAAELLRAVPTVHYTLAEVEPNHG